LREKPGKVGHLIHYPFRFAEVFDDGLFLIQLGGLLFVVVVPHDFFDHLQFLELVVHFLEGCAVAVVEQVAPVLHQFLHVLQVEQLGGAVVLFV
jgi:hypothetical protein